VFAVVLAGIIVWGLQPDSNGITFKSTNGRLKILSVRWFANAPFVDGYISPMDRARMDAASYALKHGLPFGVAEKALAGIKESVAESSWPAMVVYCSSKDREVRGWEYFQLVNDNGQKAYLDFGFGHSQVTNDLVLIYHTPWPTMDWRLTNGLYHLSHCGTNWADISVKLRGPANTGPR